MFVLHTSKTHWTDSKPQVIKIKSEDKLPKQQRSMNMLCPYMALQEYLDVRPTYIDNNEPFFILQDRQPVKPDLVRKVLKTTLTKEGFNPSCYNTYSLRAGCCVDIQHLSMSVESIRILGRWRSNSIYAYLRHL